MPVICENGFYLTISKLVGVVFSLSTTDVVLHKGFNKIVTLEKCKKMCQGC